MKASLDLMGYPDRDSNDMTWEKDPGGQERWILTFDGVLSESPLTEVMQRMLKALEEVYDYPVDIEFTVNFTGEDRFAVNLVQCRPLQTKGEGRRVSLPDNIPERDLLFRTDGTFMGSNTMQPIRRIVSVDPEGYHRLALTEKYDIARLIGKINRQIVDREQLPTLLIGPGRWGTTTPSLGVPVRFAEINNMCLMVELGHMGGGLMPELSFGTHFFQDLVETDIFYVALFPDAEQSYLNRELLIEGTNLLKDLLPEQRKYENVVMVKDLGKDRYYLCADVVAQRVLCYRGTSEDS
jgi:hypothetical protein